MYCTDEDLKHLLHTSYNYQLSLTDLWQSDIQTYSQKDYGIYRASMASCSKNLYFISLRWHGRNTF